MLSIWYFITVTEQILITFDEKFTTAAFKPNQYIYDIDNLNTKNPIPLNE